MSKILAFLKAHLGWFVYGAGSLISLLNVIAGKDRFWWILVLIGFGYAIIDKWMNLPKTTTTTTTTTPAAK
jgi:hypothetical protein